MKQSDTINKLATALVAAQSEIRAVQKDSTNPDFRSKYASLDTIIEHVRPVLSKHGLAIVQGGTTPDTNEHGAVTAFSVETMLIHASGEFITNNAVMPVVGRMLKGGGVGEVNPQSAGSALSYGRRYGLAALLCIATEEDDDGNHASRPLSRPQVEKALDMAPVKPVDTRGYEDIGGTAKPTDDATCPKCGGQMYDNRLTKKNPKAPDFKCKDRACDGVVWPPKNTPQRETVPPHTDDDFGF